MKEEIKVYEFKKLKELGRAGYCACELCRTSKYFTSKEIYDKDYYLCNKCFKFVDINDIESISNRFNISPEQCQNLKLNIQLKQGVKNNSKLSNEQKLSAKIARFQCDVNKSNRFTLLQFYKRFANNPICYLTREPIDLDDVETYQLDHIIPKSKGGDSTLDNCGLLKSKVNIAKLDMTPNEFIELCKKIAKIWENSTFEKV